MPQQISFAVLKFHTTYMKPYSIHGFFCSVYYIWDIFMLCVSIVDSFKLMNSIPLYRYTIVCNIVLVFILRPMIDFMLIFIHSIRSFTIHSFFKKDDKLSQEHWLNTFSVLLWIILLPLSKINKFYIHGSTSFSILFCLLCGLFSTTLISIVI